MNLIERMIVESLSKSAKTLKELALDIKIEEVVVVNALQGLVVKSIVTLNNEIYDLNKGLSRSVIEEINDNKSLLIEVNQIVRSTIKLAMETENDHVFKLKKVAMSETDYKIFKSMLINLEKFLSGLAKDNKEMSTSEQQVIFWGHQKYLNAAQSILESV